MSISADELVALSRLVIAAKAVRADHQLPTTDSLVELEAALDRLDGARSASELEASQRAMREARATAAQAREFAARFNTERAGAVSDELTIAEERDLFEAFSYVAEGKPRRLSFSVGTPNGKRSRWTSLERKGFLVVEGIDIFDPAYFSLRATEKGQNWLRARLAEARP